MKSLENLLHVILAECGDRCHVSTGRDSKRITERIEHEGFSFLTITLPTFCKNFERSLAMGRVDSNLFAGFQFREGLPVFLRGFLSQVFDPSTGWLRDMPSLEAIRSIRQICLLFSKVEIPCSDARVKAALNLYVTTEQEVSEWDFDSRGDLLQRFVDVSLLIWDEVLSAVDSKSL